jgi:hypothetical protein
MGILPLAPYARKLLRLGFNIQNAINLAYRKPEIDLDMEAELLHQKRELLEIKRPALIDLFRRYTIFRHSENPYVSLTSSIKRAILYASGLPFDKIKPDYSMIDPLIRKCRGELKGYVSLIRVKEERWPYIMSLAEFMKCGIGACEDEFCILGFVSADEILAQIPLTSLLSVAPHLNDDYELNYPFIPPDLISQYRFEPRDLFSKLSCPGCDSHLYYYAQEVLGTNQKTLKVWEPPALRRKEEEGSFALADRREKRRAENFLSVICHKCGKSIIRRRILHSRAPVNIVSSVVDRSRRIRITLRNIANEEIHRIIFKIKVIPRISAKLVKPRKINFPTNLKDRIRYDNKSSHIVFDGRMTNKERDQLLRLSKSKDYQKIIKLLFNESRNCDFTVPYDIVDESPPCFFRDGKTLFSAARMECTQCPTPHRELMNDPQLYESRYRGLLPGEDKELWPLKLQVGRYCTQINIHKIFVTTVWFSTGRQWISPLLYAHRN